MESNTFGINWNAKCETGLIAQHHFLTTLIMLMGSKSVSDTELVQLLQLSVILGKWLFTYWWNCSCNLLPYSHKSVTEDGHFWLAFGIPILSKGDCEGYGQGSVQSSKVIAHLSLQKKSVWGTIVGTGDCQDRFLTRLKPVSPKY